MSFALEFPGAPFEQRSVQPPLSPPLRRTCRNVLRMRAAQFYSQSTVRSQFVPFSESVEIVKTHLTHKATINESAPVLRCGAMIKQHVGNAVQGRFRHTGTLSVRTRALSNEFPRRFVATSSPFLSALTHKDIVLSLSRSNRLEMYAL